MTPIDRLIQADRETKKRICVIGCSMEDVWLHGDMLPSQDGVMKFVERRRLTTPGGAAGAARQLTRWNCEVALVSIFRPSPGEAWNQVPSGYALECRRMPTKTRYIDSSGRIVFRHDLDNGYGLDANGMTEARDLALKAVRGCHWDAVLIADYEKGFVDEHLIWCAIEHCNAKGISVVADAKRHPNIYRGAILKANDAWHSRWEEALRSHGGAGIITRGRQSPVLHNFTHANTLVTATIERPVHVASHVGAGDCFAAHLTLALAHSLSLEEAASIAHSAGRIYVQHEHGRAPWPREIRKDLDPVGGKVVVCSDLAALRRSIPGRVVLANGVFRLPHAGHAWLLERAREQGDVLVVGMNSDVSAANLKPGKRALPFEERARILGSMSSVDWIVGYDEPDPCEVIRALKPDLLAKGHDYAGHDYAGQAVPGHDLVPAVWFAPESPFPRHSSDL